MLSEKSSQNRLSVIALLAAGAIGVALRLWLASRGHNFDIDSWRIAADLFAKHENIYTGTYRYPYGPVWYVLVGLLGQLHDLLGLNRLGPESFHLVVAAFLSLVDVAIALLLYRVHSLSAALFVLLNPISILLTGYHSQIDNLAVLSALGSWLMLGHRGRPDALVPWPRILMSAMLLGISLATKHLMIFFPIWVLVCPVIVGPISRRLTYALLAWGIFVAGFLPFLSSPGAPQAIYRHVIQYGGYSEAALMPRVVDLFLPARGVNTLLGTLRGGQAMQWLFILCMLLVSRPIARVRPEALFVCYLLSIVIFSCVDGDQYLAIPIVACAILGRRWPVWIYTVLGAALVAWTAQQNGVLPGTRPIFHSAFGMALSHRHAVVWLAVLLIGITSGFGRRRWPCWNEQEGI